MDKNEEKLFDLLNHKEYDQLNIEEKDFVNHFIGEEKYVKRRLIIKSASMAFEKENKVSPKPLPLPRNSASSGFFQKQIPLYYALTGVAVTLIFMIGLIPFFSNTEMIKKEVQVVQNDTVEVIRQVHDTIFQEKEVLVYIEKETRTTTNEYVKCQREEERLLETGTAALPPINTEDLNNKGISLANDSSSKLIPEPELFNHFLKN